MSFEAANIYAKFIGEVLLTPIDLSTANIYALAIGAALGAPITGAAGWFLRMWAEDAYKRWRGSRGRLVWHILGALPEEGEERSTVIVIKGHLANKYEKPRTIFKPTIAFSYGGFEGELELYWHGKRKLIDSITIDPNKPEPVTMYVDIPRFVVERILEQGVTPDRGPTIPSITVFCFKDEATGLDSEIPIDIDIQEFVFLFESMRP